MFSVNFYNNFINHNLTAQEIELKSRYTDLYVLTM